MADTSEVRAKIDTELKTNAEEILGKLGITPSNAIQMLYSWIVLTKEMPFELRLPYKKPAAIGGMTREELDAELQRGIDSLKSEKIYTSDEVYEHFFKGFEI